MSKNLNDLLNDKNKGKDESRSLLTALFRTILKDLAILPSQWYDLCNKYYRSPVSSVKKNTRDIGQARNNLSRVIASDEISWKTFFRAVQILGPRSIKLTCELTWRDGRVTTHTTTPAGNEIVIYTEVEEIKARRKAAKEAADKKESGDNKDDD